MKVYRLHKGNSVIVTDISSEDNETIEHIFATYHGEPPRPGAYDDRIYLIENNCNSFIRHKYLRSSMDSFEIDYIFLDAKDFRNIDIFQSPYETGLKGRIIPHLIITMLRNFFLCRKFRREILKNKEISKEKDEELYSHLKNCGFCKDWLIEQSDIKIDFNLNEKEG